MRSSKRFISAVTVSILSSTTALALPDTKAINDTVKESSKQPAEIEADSMHYDKESGLVKATGSVEVIQGSIVLLADEVRYNQKNNTVEAVGNVSLMEPDGNVMFADNVMLKDDLKAGVIERFKIRFQDNSILTAQRGERKNGNINTLEKVTYTPCKVCEEDEKKGKKPLWQVRADKAVVNEEKQKITYKNAFFDVKGVPVMYTPYLAHPTPGADAKSGFLIPKYTNDEVFGSMVSVPYYYTFASNKDVTLTPIITSKEAPILAGEYRHLLPSGEYYLKGSITNPDRVDTNGEKIEGRDVRGHVEGEGEFNIDEQWSWGFNAKRASDDTYLEKYNFGHEDTLTSRLYTTSIENRDSIHVETLSFQGLKTNDDPGQSPVILPSAVAHFESRPGWLGSRWLTDASLLSLTRDEGVSTHRMSIKEAWRVPYITKSGHVLEFRNSVRGDAYYVDHVQEDPNDPNSPLLDGTAGRFIPQSEVKWTYPIAGRIFKKSAFLEPTVSAIVSPYGNNPNKIPNEDAQDVEFSDENLFDSNHFTGLDQVEGGPRLNYGLRGRVQSSQKSDVGFLFGQNYHTKANNHFSPRSGLDEHFSDFVGRVSYRYNDTLDLAYRFRLDKNSISLNRNAFTAALNYAPVTVSLDYLSVDDSFDSTISNLDAENRELVIAGASLDLTDDWTLTANGHRNLESGEWVSTKTSLFYTVDCIDFGLTWFKEFTRDRDIRPNTTVSFEISLKNLGN